MDLIIVESPTKAKTLSRFLGGVYSVEATMGHIKDLPKSKLAIDIENNFTPQYEIVEKRIDTIKKLKAKSQKSKNIYIATDPDREGEAIAQHTKEVLLSNLKDKSKNIKFFRIVFHEITKEAVEEAIKNPRDVDKNMVDAQVARRVLDRLVGYKLSPLLWKKIRRGLSAGRVQSVAVRLIVEKEKEIEKFKPEEYWEIYCHVKSQKSDDNNGEFVVQLAKIDGNKAEIGNEELAKEVVGELDKSDYKVFAVDKKEVNKNPYPPFTTSTLAQAGARIFRWSSKKTMSVAQVLYEEGLITYHRTDSLNISKQALFKARDFISGKYGSKYIPEKPRFYKTTSRLAQEAHEAIRPTDVEIKSPGIQSSRFLKDAGKLYELIWKRFIASQMAASVYDETQISVIAITKKAEQNSKEFLLRASGQTMKFDGWRKVYGGILADNETQLPGVGKDELLDLLKIDPQQKFTQPPARYTEATLIKTLEKLGIGRPSTYAPIISTIQLRQYVEKKDSKFFPTPVGIAVNNFLVGNFPQELDYQFTAKMENGLDEIANGNAKWEKEIGQFWSPFSKKLLDVDKNSKRVKIEAEKLGKKCPLCKEGELVIRTGRFGKFISCSRFPDCKYTEKFVEKIDMKCPKCSGGEVIVKKTKKGRVFYGCSRYPKCKWASWQKPKK